MKRNRILYAVAIVVVIALGLGSRRHPEWLPAGLGKYPGDALWALMVFGGIGFLRPKLTPGGAALAAFTFSCAVEFFKLYQAPWIESVRHTLPGRLVLGSVFSWRNLAAYAAGILTGWLVETRLGQFQAGKNPARRNPPGP